MIEKTIFPREEKAEVLFDKIKSDSWAYNKLFQTFCDNLFCNDDSGTEISPLEFTEALFNCYINKDLSAFLMAISQNTLFDLLRNSFLIPYRFNADGKQNPIIMTDDNGMLLSEYKNVVHEKDYQHFYNIIKIFIIIKIYISPKLTDTATNMVMTHLLLNSRFLKKIQEYCLYANFLTR